MSTIDELAPFNAAVPFVNPNGTLSRHAVMALGTIFQRVGGFIGDSGRDVLAPFLQDQQSDAVVQQPAPGDRVVEVLQQPAQRDDLGEMVAQPLQPAQLPVGFIFISAVSTDPAQLLGYGTWTQFGAGKMLASYLNGDPDFGTPGGTGGVKSITIDAHASHTHSVTSNVTATTAAAQSGAGTTVVTAITNNAVASGTESAPLTHAESGVSPIKTLPPYITVYMWERTA